MSRCKAVCPIMHVKCRFATVVMLYSWKHRETFPARPLHESFLGLLLHMNLHIPFLWRIHTRGVKNCTPSTFLPLHLSGSHPELYIQRVIENDGVIHVSRASSEEGWASMLVSWAAFLSDGPASGYWACSSPVWHMDPYLQIPATLILSSTEIQLLVKRGRERNVNKLNVLKEYLSLCAEEQPLLCPCLSSYHV